MMPPMKPSSPLFRERAMGGKHLVRILDQLAGTGDCPKPSEPTTERILQPSHAGVGPCRGVQLFLIEPGKPNQNAYIESFNGRFRDECLNEHWFSPAACPSRLQRLAKEYNEERPKRNPWAV